LLSALLPGVYLTKSNTYLAKISRATISKSKTFKTEDDAFKFYKQEKEEDIRIAAEAYSFLLPKKIYDALMNYEVKPIRGVEHQSMKKLF